MQETKLRKLNLASENTQKSEFSQRFLQLIEETEKTQKELATCFGVTEGALINWKRGQTPKAEELYKIAEFYGTTMEWLLTGKDPANSPKSEDGWRQRALAAEQKLDAVKSGILAIVKKFSLIIQA